MPSEVGSLQTGFLPQSGTGMTGISKWITFRMAPWPRDSPLTTDNGPQTKGYGRLPYASRPNQDQTRSRERHVIHPLGGWPHQRLFVPLPSRPLPVCFMQ